MLKPCINSTIGKLIPGPKSTCYCEALCIVGYGIYWNCVLIVYIDRMAVRYSITRDQGKSNSLEKLPVGVPHYFTVQTAILASNKLPSLRGVAIEETTHQIFVVKKKSGVEAFTETGEFLYQLGVRQLSKPYGIAIQGDNVYVSCSDHTVSKFSLINMSLVRKIGSMGSNNGQFNYPRQLTTHPIGLVFITDFCNHRICMHDTNLNHLCNITHQSMSYPSDVKLYCDHLYILCRDDNPCMLVITLNGEKLYSFTTYGEGMHILRPTFFCLDQLNNFIVSDHATHIFRVFSPEGNLLHTIGREGHQQGMFDRPQGIAITPNGRLVCVSMNLYYYCLQILF